MTTAIYRGHHSQVTLASPYARMMRTYNKRIRTESEVLDKKHALWRLSQRQVQQADQNRHALVTTGPSLSGQDRQESGSQQAKSVDDQQKLSETFS